MSTKWKKTKGFVKRHGPDILNFLFKTSLKKALTFGMALGVGLISAADLLEVLVIQILSNNDPNFDSSQVNFEAYVAQIFGLGIFAVCLGLLFKIHKDEKLEKLRLQQEIRQGKMLSYKRSASRLAGQLFHIADKFDLSENKPAGFLTDELVKARDQARALKECLPPSITSDAIFAAMCEWSVDSSPNPDPIFDVSCDQLRLMAESLKSFGKVVTNETE